jgi:hypothetical protein
MSLVNNAGGGRVAYLVGALLRIDAAWGGAGSHRGAPPQASARRA